MEIHKPFATMDDLIDMPDEGVEFVRAGLRHFTEMNTASCFCYRKAALFELLLALTPDRIINLQWDEIDLNSGKLALKETKFQWTPSVRDFRAVIVTIEERDLDDACLTALREFDVHRCDFQKENRIFKSKKEFNEDIEEMILDLNLFRLIQKLRREGRTIGDG